MRRNHIPKIELAGLWFDPNTGIPNYYQNEIVKTENLLGMISVNNRRSSDGSYRSGLWWYMARAELSTPLSESVTVYRPFFGKQYVGAFRLFRTDGNWGAPSEWSWKGMDSIRELETLGATVYKRLRPDIPDFSSLQAVLELKDVVTPLKKTVKGFVDKVNGVSRSRVARGRSSLSKTGQYWLAIEFGWLPVLRDCLNYVEAHKNAQGRAAKLIKNEGRRHHRRTDLNQLGYQPILEYKPNTSSNSWDDKFSPAFVTQCYGGGRSHTHSHPKVERKIWAEGVFVYMLPPGPRNVEFVNKLAKRNMGVGLTPAVVYNLMPWSWLVDYFTNLGDFVDNVSSGMADRCYAEYCYVMQHEKRSVFTTATQYLVTSKDGTQHTAVTATATNFVEQKVRAYASPFGFGFKSGDLNPMQASILGAIGISKLA